MTTWIQGSEGRALEGWTKSRSETTGWCTSRSRLARRRHQRSQLSQLGQTNQCIEATGAAQSEQLGGATRPSTRRPRDEAREEQEAPQQQAPPDMRTGQSAKASLRREVPTDHEARGQAQRRQLRRVATELRRDRVPEAVAKHGKHGRIRTQISYLSRMTSDRGGEETVTSTHSDWRGRRWRGSVQQTTQHNDVPEQPSSGEACGREHVGQHVDRPTACRKQGLA